MCEFCNKAIGVIESDGAAKEIVPNFCPMCGRSLTGKTMCKCCGERVAVVKGMCHRCYNRQRAREKAGHDKPTDIWNDQSKAILHMLELGNKTQSDIAKEMNVSRQWVSTIAKKMKKFSENA